LIALFTTIFTATAVAFYGKKKEDIA